MSHRIGLIALLANFAMLLAGCGPNGGQGPKPHTGMPLAPLSAEREQAIHAVQGPGHFSPFRDREVQLTGVVTATKGRLGTWIQGQEADADIATSEGIYLAEGQKGILKGLALGDLVTASGAVREITDRDRGMALPVTTLVVEGLQVIKRGLPLPEAIVLGRGGRVPPNAVIDDDTNGMLNNPAEAGAFEPATDGIDYWESLEGMRVQVNAAQAISGVHYDTELAVVADGGADASTLNSRGGLPLAPDDANPERIILNSEGAPITLPRFAAGDRFVGPVTGVLHYQWGHPSVLIDALPEIVPAGLGREITELKGDGEHLTIASFNVMNLHPAALTEDGTPRVEAIAAVIRDHLLLPDIVGLQEMQDSSGPRNDGVTDASETYHALIKALGGAYNFCEIAPPDLSGGGQPGGNIRCGYLFRPDRVSLIENGKSRGFESMQLARDGSLSPSPGLLAVKSLAFRDSRKPLVAEFRFNGQRIVMVNCHLQSKRGDSPDFGRRQPPHKQSGERRLSQARVVASFCEDVIRRDAAARLVVLGDLNDFSWAEPVLAFKSAGLNNLCEQINTPDRYSYNYKGNSQLLDHILVQEPLAAGAQVDILHVHADFSHVARASDHDPILARLRIPQP
ncbi:MAG: putative extracellular nuclease [Rhodothermales bacterium]